MVDSTFYKNYGPFTLDEIVEGIECIIKGDGKFLSIAAASVLAKTYRDDIMKGLDLKSPKYHWKNNKGYPTKQHRKAIAKFGSNKHHRKSFQLLPTQLTLSL